MRMKLLFCTEYERHLDVSFKSLDDSKKKENDKVGVNIIIFTCFLLVIEMLCFTKELSSNITRCFFFLFSFY